MKWKFNIDQLVRYRYGSGGQHWQGVVRAREIYNDGAEQPEEAYYVRWINPNGQPYEKLERFPAVELEAQD